MTCWGCEFLFYGSFIGHEKEPCAWCHHPKKKKGLELWDAMGELPRPKWCPLKGKNMETEAMQLKKRIEELTTRIGSLKVAILERDNKIIELENVIGVINHKMHCIANGSFSFDAPRTATKVIVELRSADGIPRRILHAANTWTIEASRNYQILVVKNDDDPVAMYRDWSSVSIDTGAETD